MLAPCRDSDTVLLSAIRRAPLNMEVIEYLLRHTTQLQLSAQSAAAAKKPYDYAGAMLCSVEPGRALADVALAAEGDSYALQIAVCCGFLDVFVMLVRHGATVTPQRLQLACNALTSRITAGEYVDDDEYGEFGFDDDARDDIVDTPSWQDLPRNVNAEFIGPYPSRWFNALNYVSSQAPLKFPPKPLQPSATTVGKKISVAREAAAANRSAAAALRAAQAQASPSTSDSKAAVDTKEVKSCCDPAAEQALLYAEHARSVVHKLWSHEPDQFIKVYAVERESFVKSAVELLAVHLVAGVCNIVIEY